MPRIFSCCAVLFSVAVTPLAAEGAELVVRDIGIGLQMQPTDFDFTLKDTTLDRSGTDGFDSGYGLVVRGLYSFTGAGVRHGFLAGGGLTYAQYTYDPDGTMTIYGLDGAGGYGFAITDRWYVGALARLGFGYSHMEMPQLASHPSFTADGGYITYGAELTTGFAITSRVVAGFDVGYRFDNHVLTGTRDTDLTLDVSGLALCATVMWRLSSAPWRLE